MQTYSFFNEEEGIFIIKDRITGHRFLTGIAEPDAKMVREGVSGYIKSKLSSKY